MPLLERRSFMLRDEKGGDESTDNDHVVHEIAELRSDIETGGDRVAHGLEVIAFGCSRFTHRPSPSSGSAT